MDNLYLLKELLALYGATTIPSLIFNRIYYKNRIQKAYDQSKRKITYKELSMECNEDLSALKSLCKSEKALSTFCSIIPVFQIFYTIRNIYINTDDFNDFFDEKMEEINNKELNMRLKYLETIIKEKDLPQDVKENMNKDEYLPDEEEYLKVLVYKKFKDTNK